MVVFLLSGFPGAAMGIGLFTAMQQFSPPGTLGRVAGVNGALGALTRALGSLIAGALVASTDLIRLLDVQGCIYLVCGLLAWIFIRDGRRPAGPTRRR